MDSKSRVWISWEIHQRNRSLAVATGFYLLEINYGKKGASRYLKSISRTVTFLFKKKPDLVVVQNPSIVLSLVTLLCKPLLKYYLIVDAHNSGIFPLDGKCRPANYISKVIQRKSDLTIVTNTNLSDEVKANGGNPCVLPDKLPQVPQNAGTFPVKGKRNVVFICSFHSDEPYSEVLKAAPAMNDVTLYITGNYREKIKNVDIPQNVIFTGYLPEVNYWSLLLSSDVIMDLTTRENCLVCGAYEAVSIGKPMVLSDTKAIKNYFTRGCTYAEPTDVSIAASVNELFSSLDHYTEQVKLLKEELELNWSRCLHEFQRCIPAKNVE